MDDLPGPREPLGLPAKTRRTGAPGRNLRRDGTAGDAGQILSSCHLLRRAGARACQRRLLREIGNGFGLEKDSGLCPGLINTAASWLRRRRRYLAWSRECECTSTPAAPSRKPWSKP